MNARALLFCFLTAALAFPALAQDPPKCKLVRIAEWPIRLVGGHPILDGAINGKKINVLLDTGAYASTLMKSAAEKLDLPTRPTQEIAAGFGGTSRVYVTTIQEVRLGEAVRNNWRVRVVGERPFGNIDFILGDDFFKLVDLEFDYAKSVVRVFQPQDCKNAFLGYWDPNAHQVALEKYEDKIVMQVKVNGRAARAMLDSGATGSIVSLAFAEELGLTRNSPALQPANCSGGIGAGISRNWVARFDSVTIGNENIRDPQLRIVDYTTDMAHVRGTPPDMFIGADFLKTHRVYVSRSQDKVYFSYNGGLVFPAMPSVECDERVAGKSPKEALAVFDSAIAANPNDAKALVQRASLRLREKDPPGALEDLNAAIRVEPANGFALAMRASARAQLKDFDGAFADTDAAIANGIRSAQIYASRGGIRRAQGDCERAIVEYEEALKLDPQHQGALRGRDVCRGGADAKKGT